MRWLFILCVCLLVSVAVRAQSYNQLVEQARLAIVKEREKYDQADYTHIQDMLARAMSLAPQRAEAYYLLGHVYGYSTCASFSQANTLRVTDVMRTSEAFETVLKLNPAYDTPIIALSPRSKLSSEWGVLALCYLVHGKTDSAIWSLNEGRLRGGFTPFLCSYYKAVLNGMDRDALCFSWGDEIFMYTLYLQLIEHVREDITLLNTETLGERWLSEYYYHRLPGLFSSNKVAADTVAYVSWKEHDVMVPVAGTADTFVWTIAPTYEGGYLVRSNLMLIDIFRNNAFRRPVYFQPGTPERAAMGLMSQAGYSFLSMRILFPAQQGLAESFVKNMNDFPLEIVTNANPKNLEERRNVTDLRGYMLYGIAQLHKDGRTEEAAAQLSRVLRYIPESRFKYASETEKKYVAAMRKEYKL